MAQPSGTAKSLTILARPTGAQRFNDLKRLVCPTRENPPFEQKGLSPPLSNRGGRRKPGRYRGVCECGEHAWATLTKGFVTFETWLAGRSLALRDDSENRKGAPVQGRPCDSHSPLRAGRKASSTCEIAAILT
jgi:hypothetical protein